jgi:hypothetical protein
MSAKKPTNLAASVRQRLYDLARAGGEELQPVLTRYGVERLLHRLCTEEGLRLKLQVDQERVQAHNHSPSHLAGAADGGGTLGTLALAPAFPYSVRRFRT